MLRFEFFFSLVWCRSYSLCSDEDALLNTQCPRNLELRWQTEVTSSVYATPLIADINRFAVSLLDFEFLIEDGEALVSSPQNIYIQIGEKKYIYIYKPLLNCL